jgi:hypothetical protein
MSLDDAVNRAIQRAERLLPGRPVAAGKVDPRWRAIIRVGTFIDSHPQEVCRFAIKWAKRARGHDLAAAIYCCLIEHLLERHFDVIFPLFREAALKNARVADYFYPYSPYFKLGQTEMPKNVARQKRLSRELERVQAAKQHMKPNKQRQHRTKKQKTAAI